ncbi:MAG: hypothetical protein DI551_05320 [Micavibrio aeruginosavorus]|uniref:Uncharacterized protein n=1 Tax=Micavibrio aeruginosavorus TaxID=349221 RepID=A0A2W5MYR7_9BACT|nr:MAG: hypothetical protein DI551_05320 [Micavibrio aeruginosavorus]
MKMPVSICPILQAVCKDHLITVKQFYGPDNTLKQEALKDYIHRAHCDRGMHAPEIARKLGTHTVLAQKMIDDFCEGKISGPHTRDEAEWAAADTMVYPNPIAQKSAAALSIHWACPPKMENAE